jgi:predicted RNA-binding protein with PIN domain
VPDPTLYLFDGWNIARAGGIEDRGVLVDRLAGWVALRGARGVVVFDGVGEEQTVGPLEVRFDADADRVIERLAAEHRSHEVVCVVSSDTAVRETAGVAVRKRASKEFFRELEGSRGTPPAPPSARSRLEDALDDETRARLERFRRSR